MKLSKYDAAIKYNVDNGLITADLKTGLIYRNGDLCNISIKKRFKNDKLGYPQVHARCDPNYPTKSGFIQIKVHRVIAYIKFGDIALQPGRAVDHINSDKNDSRGDNIRLVTTEYTIKERIKKSIPFTKSTPRPEQVSIRDPITGKCIAIFYDKELAREYKKWKLG